MASMSTGRGGAVNFTFTLATPPPPSLRADVYFLCFCVKQRTLETSARRLPPLRVLERDWSVKTEAVKKLSRTDHNFLSSGSGWASGTVTGLVTSIVLIVHFLS